MNKKTFWISLCFILISSISSAQEVIPSYSNSTVPVLNDELRKISLDIRKSNEDISNISSVPSGLICMWKGSIATIPSGWYLCDGNNGTPDLRNRFVIAADADASGVAKTTVTGSATQSGDGTIPAHAHSFTSYTYGDSGEPVGVLTSANCMSTRNTASYGTGTKNIAVYFALAFIMKS
jgi:hypothetical protein